MREEKVKNNSNPSKMQNCMYEFMYAEKDGEEMQQL